MKVTDDLIKKYQLMSFSVHLVICCRSRFFNYGTELSILLIIWTSLYMTWYFVAWSTISWFITISDLMAYFTLLYCQAFKFHAAADHQVIFILNVHFWACSYYPLYFIHFKLLAPNFRYDHHAVWCSDTECQVYKTASKCYQLHR